MITKVKQAMLAMTRQCWEQGIVASALYELEDDELLHIVINDMIRRRSQDGRLCNVEDTPALTDSAFCIPAVYLTGNEEGNSEYLLAAEKNLRYLLAKADRGADGTLFHIAGTKQVWADSAAYVPYVMALMGEPEAGLAQLHGIQKRLYNEESGLYYHMWDDASQSYVRAYPWGAGNGWILGGMLRLYSVLDGKYQAERQELETEINRLLDRMLQLKTDNDLFYDILDDPTSFEESEASVMVAYGIYYGINLGIVSASYKSTADKIAEAVERRINVYGEIEGAASSPDFVSPGVSVECQANYILMKLEQQRTCPA